MSSHFHNIVIPHTLWYFNNEWYLEMFELQEFLSRTVWYTDYQRIDSGRFLPAGVTFKKESFLSPFSSLRLQQRDLCVWKMDLLVPCHFDRKNPQQMWMLRAALKVRTRKID